MYNVNVPIKRESIGLVNLHKRKLCEAFNLKSINFPKSVQPHSDHEIVNIQLVINQLELEDSEDNFKMEFLKYVESCASIEGEDSSYDSEEGDDYIRNHLDNLRASQNLNSGYISDHEQVSRTTSDTLGQEFAEYVSLNNSENIEYFSSPAYKTRVEFALKLGYSERLVQAALSCLGPDPTQNELLAELIKLGAQYGNANDFFTDFCGTENILAKEADPCLSEGSNSNNSLRAIVVDGSNVAMSHGNKEFFSCRGIKLCVDWFKNRGHKDITVFVPKWRKENSRIDNPIVDQEILNELERERMLVFTPSRMIGGKRMICYDDRYILKLAVDTDGIVVSNDNYRDLASENSDFKKVVEERVLMFSFVNDRFMPPDDPLGRSGPTLENFLRIAPLRSEAPLPCLYGKKCTYGNKCKYSHPERGHGPIKSVTEKLSEHAARHLSGRISVTEITRTPIKGKSLSVPLNTNSSNADCNHYDRLGRKPLCRSRSGVPEYQQQINPMPGASQATWNKTSFNATEYKTEENAFSFSKSHSIENISRENKSQPNYISPWNFHTVHLQANATGKNLRNRSHNETIDETLNPHRKLHRQLTLNPADPRVYHLQRGMTPGTENNASKIPQQTPLSAHRPLVTSISGPGTYHSNQWNSHQSVTRISSAPAQVRSNNSSLSNASVSEPQINLWPQHKQSMFLTTQDQRRRLHYHLSSLFPEEQVQTVMQMYPDETNPQTICAAILNIFPKN